jgi:DNA-binding NarL/FixJ family response regulator
METVTGVKRIEPNTLLNSNDNSNHTFEVVIIEDNHLVNTLLTKALDSTIKSIYNLKNIEIKFASYKNGSDFLAYLEKREQNSSKLIVFSDYHLEEDMNGAKILSSIKQKFADATVIIMSDSPNQQIPIDAKNLGAHCFLSKDHRTPVICSEMLFQMVN